MSDWRTLPDAPESVKYWAGYDPADPPLSNEPPAACDKCGVGMEPTESGYCVNCDQPAPICERCKVAMLSNAPNGLCAICDGDPLSLMSEPIGMVAVLNDIRRRFERAL